MMLHFTKDADEGSVSFINVFLYLKHSHLCTIDVTQTGHCDGWGQRQTTKHCLLPDWTRHRPRQSRKQQVRH